MKKNFKKRVNKFIKRYLLSILFAAGVFVLLLAAFNELHSIATAQRGYEAIGGEIMVFFLPVIIYAVIENYKDIKKVNERQGR